MRVAAVLLVLSSVLLGLSIRQAAMQRGAATRLRVLNLARLHYLLNAQDFDRLGGTLSPEFGVTDAENGVILSSSGAFEVQPGARGAAFKRLAPPTALPTAIAVSGNTLLGIRSFHLGDLTPKGFEEAVPLPCLGMRLAPSLVPGRVYLFGGSPNIARRAYCIRSDGTLEILAELPAEVVAIADSGGGNIYLAMSHEILHWTKEAIGLTLRLPSGWPPIQGLAADWDNRTLFFSAGRKVYLVRRSMVVTVVEDAGGSLRWRRGKLYLLDSQRRLLVALEGLNREAEGNRQ